MVARIDWGPLERERNTREEKVITQSFAIRSHDGWISGKIIVLDTSDAAARAEIESRLALLLRDALTVFGR